VNNWLRLVLALLLILGVCAMNFAHGATPASPVVSSQDIQLVWSAPTKNTDGTALTNLSGFKLYHRLFGANAFDPPIVLSVMATKYVFTQGDGNHVYALSAFNATGQESALSQAFQIAVKSVTVIRIPNAPQAPQLTVKP
jgi:hypothetical protein